MTTRRFPPPWINVSRLTSDFEEAKYAAIPILAVVILFGMSVGIALFFHFV
jgi:hypothetical protein